MSMSDKNLSEVNINNITDIQEKSKFEIIDINHTYKNFYGNKKISRPNLTKFERCKILGIRTEQISSGSTPLIELDNTETSAYEIAKKEFDQKKIPFIIRRYLPDNKYEDWRLNELIY